MFGGPLVGGNRTSDPQWLKQIEVSQAPDGKSRGQSQVGTAAQGGPQGLDPGSSHFTVLTLLAAASLSGVSVVPMGCMEDHFL